MSTRDPNILDFLDSHELFARQTWYRVLRKKTDFMSGEELLSPLDRGCKEYDHRVKRMAAPNASWDQQEPIFRPCIVLQKKSPRPFCGPPGPQLFKVASRTSRSMNRCKHNSSTVFPARFEATLNIGVRGGDFYFAEPGLRYQRFLDFSKTECKRAQDQGVVLISGLRGA